MRADNFVLSLRTSTRCGVVDTGDDVLGVASIKRCCVV